jgi:hypothetical protein
MLSKSQKTLKIEAIKMVRHIRSEVNGFIFVHLLIYNNNYIEL